MMSADLAMSDDEPEDRGTPVWIWIFPNNLASFYAHGNARRIEVSVSIGWNLAPDPMHGVILRNTFGRVMTAGMVRTYAEMGWEGFRVRSPGN